MAKTPSSDGRRDLSLIRASGSTARVLNLALVFERFGQSEDFLERPLFRNHKLNRALILKHAVRVHERGLFERPEPHTTKIVFPFSATELGIGGTSAMVGERKFTQLLRKAVGAEGDKDDFEADCELLTLLHELPSFDPFLLREQLKRAGHQPARCFFDVSDADVASMLVFVQAAIAPLVGAAFGAAGRRATWGSSTRGFPPVRCRGPTGCGSSARTRRRAPWGAGRSSPRWRASGHGSRGAGRSARCRAGSTDGFE